MTGDCKRRNAEIDKLRDKLDKIMIERKMYYMEVIGGCEFGEIETVEIEIFYGLSWWPSCSELLIEYREFAVEWKRDDRGWPIRISSKEL